LATSAVGTALFGASEASVLALQHGFATELHCFVPLGWPGPTEDDLFEAHIRRALRREVDVGLDFPGVGSAVAGGAALSSEGTLAAAAGAAPAATPSSPGADGGAAASVADTTWRDGAAALGDARPRSLGFQRVVQEHAATMLDAETRTEALVQFAVCSECVSSSFNKKKKIPDRASDPP
jgi:hypothetical protein